MSRQSPTTYGYPSDPAVLDHAAAAILAAGAPAPVSVAVMPCRSRRVPIDLWPAYAVQAIPTAILQTREGSGEKATATQSGRGVKSVHP